MTDISLQKCHQIRRSGNAGLLARLWRNWRARSQLKRMQQYNDHLLHDIGITRDELSWASRLPLTVNAGLALEDLAYRRRKEDRYMWL